ncbi:MAG: hypothetical protein K2H98_03640, partial [Duncaniella sp.]|nr:hypothetical protein [Duncaniella sp.]
TRLWADGDTSEGDKVEEISEGTYNALITGGENAICNYVLGVVPIRSGSRIINARMSVIREFFREE